MLITGALLKSEALDIAAIHGHVDFTASNDWIQSFIAWHQIKFSNLHGESAGMDPQVCSQWMQQLPATCKGYALKDIWNVDETGIFFRSVPNKSFTKKGEAWNVNEIGIFFRSVPNKSFIKKGEVSHYTNAQTLKERFTVY